MQLIISDLTVAYIFSCNLQNANLQIFSTNTRKGC